MLTTEHVSSCKKYHYSNLSVIRVPRIRFSPYPGAVKTCFLGVWGFFRGFFWGVFIVFFVLFFIALGGYFYYFGFFYWVLLCFLGFFIVLGGYFCYCPVSRISPYPEGVLELISWITEGLLYILQVLKVLT